ncbi:MAG: hypothetical protein GX130_09985 [Candidatus Hydrogenedens sp.]|jgi:hypothetical protein|nr:hypothetical protein [Candidatus Hydrogenedens sp.]
MRVGNTLCGWLCILIFLVMPALQASEPALPPGLEAVSQEKTEPALPAGLEPSLPAGLEPALPAGLEAADQEKAEPSLPAGLEPALPAGLEGLSVPEEEKDTLKTEKKESPLDFHGFWDVRGGSRITSDRAQSKDATLGEMRLQLKTDKGWDRVFIEFTGDSVFDAVEERARIDIRQLRLTWTPVDSLDFRIGRQVLTWGTGDMLFINDLFPKDWRSYFSGRDVEYLKAPSNALRVGWFNDVMNVEVAYAPRFNPDRYITGKRFSYFSPMHGRTVGRSQRLQTQEPKDWFDNDEVALRLYRNIGSTQLAFYGYSGYWKSPGGMQLIPSRAVFPKLRAYGASLRGALGKGIANIEIGYYDSYQDRSGSNPFVNNSEFRLLIGYEREIGHEFTASVQYYLEHMMRYRAYKRTLPFFMHARDQDRHLFTLRLTKQLMQQNLILSLFAYGSPSDADGYLRPNITYKINDNWTVDFGGNIFLGRHNYSFFGQFQDNTNIYGGVRVSF